ncbi:hypothetical protein J2Y69_002131 [Microbacterium resistens]|uniref:Uncharacterized protein n=1 Tax=Microbacterium resistens TaxID=156977 RepID=A0ABU1SD58_9MICO|nr:hypothetical protein [Microbacterium resistens]MDR6867527.1 hypothetical protein [Microbacterium resistens]
MKLRTYATVSDYNEVAEEEWPAEDEGTLTKRLRAASVEVEKLTRRSWYETDADGFPTDPEVSDAFTEATCAIAEYWALTDDPTGADAVDGAVKIGSVSLGTTSSSAENLSAIEKLQRRIGSRAIDILTNAGLIQSAVSHT